MTCSVIWIKNSSHTFVLSPQLTYFYKRTFYQHDPAALGCAGTPTAWEGCVQISQVSTFHTGAEEIHLDLKSVFPVTFNKLLFYCGSFPWIFKYTGLSIMHQAFSVEGEGRGSQDATSNEEFLGIVEQTSTVTALKVGKHSLLGRGVAEYLFNCIKMGCYFTLPA